MVQLLAETSKLILVFLPSLLPSNNNLLPLSSAIFKLILIILAIIPLKKIFLPIFLASGTIFAFIFSFNKTDTNSTISINSSNSKSSDQKKIDKTTLNPNQLQKLSVLPLRCIGCGRCVRIDPSHFEISATTGKSIVISSTNLNSQNLIIAINNCPVQAITLN